MPRPTVAAERILQLVDLFHKVTHRLVNGVLDDSVNPFAQWCAVLGAERVALLTQVDENVDGLKRVHLDRMAAGAILEVLTSAALDRKLDPSRFYDVLGNIVRAPIEKWDGAWSLVRVLHDLAQAELDSKVNKPQGRQSPRSSRATVSAVDAALRQLLETDRAAFLAFTRDDLASKLGVSGGLVSKTPTWREHRRRRGPRPKAVGLDAALDEDARLKHLIKDQQRDDRSHRVYKHP